MCLSEDMYKFEMLSIWMIQNGIFLNLSNAFPSQEPSGGNVWPRLSELHGMYTVSD